MILTVPLALLLVLVTLALVRWAGQHPGHAIVAFLAGIFVASTAVGPVIRNAAESLANALVHLQR